MNTISMNTITTTVLTTIASTNTAILAGDLGKYKAFLDDVRLNDM